MSDLQPGLVTYLAHEESPLRMVDCTDAVTMEAIGPIQHLCPYVDEVDHGTVTISWTTEGRTLELHSLRAYLDTFAGSKVSHEAVAALIQGDLQYLRGIADVHVSLQFGTADFVCRVDALPL